jgi:multidrug efflux pump subunit AcrA (membrane-fusion protein)
MNNLFRVMMGLGIAGAFIVAGFALAAVSHDLWKGFVPGAAAEKKEEGHGHGHGADDQVHLSATARKNMGLVVEPLELRTEKNPYPRSIQLLGKVVERPGEGDRSVTSPFAGVVTEIAKLPGEVVRPGDTLFVLQPTSEYLQETQARLYKAALDLEINLKEQSRLRGIPDGESLFRARLIELGYEKDRLEAALKAYRQELRARLLPLFNDLENSTERDRKIEQQLDAIERQGRFLTRIEIKAPGERSMSTPVAGAAGPSASPPKETSDQAIFYEVEDLKVRVGSQAQAGETLCRLGNHALLYIEGQAFEQDVPLLQEAIDKGWTVRADFREEADADQKWAKAIASSGPQPPVELDKLRILYLSNRLDANTKTFPFYILLPNQRQHQTRPDTGRSYLFWRFRVDQPVRLNIQVGEFSNVFILPIDAVAREGPDAYVFRAKVYQKEGEIVLQRKPVHVLHEDSRNVVVANDGSVAAGSLVAQNGAAQLNRVLKAQIAGGGEEGHGHSHAGHSHD